MTSRPAHAGTGASDQSDHSRVTTAPTCGAPSLISTPALIHVRASTRTIAPAWSYSSSKAATKDTSTAESAGNGASSACPVSRTKP
ncbi:hypothetical protein SRIMM317S_03697 [Streptomyces rimosus subsp. rimosus]